MSLRIILVLLVSSLILVSCNRPIKPSKHTSSQYVDVRQENGRYQLYRNGLPYFIKGASVYKEFPLLKESGGNSIRLYNVNADSALLILDKAHQEGLTVTVGLDVAPAEILDYNDEQAVAAQLKRIKQDVLKLKNHPALLMWGIGNELSFKMEYSQIMDHYPLWQAINDISKLIHEHDPNHPTTTMIPPYPKLVIYISFLCNDIDVLSLNIFEEESNLLRLVLNWVWRGSFMVSEYGGPGHWEEDHRTDWYAKAELTSFGKSQIIQKQYQTIIENNSKCLGSYVFIWYQKQEYTTTWFSLFTETGQPTEIIDALQYCWTKKWPINRAPSIASLTINCQKESNNIYLEKNQKFYVTFKVRNAESENLQINWEIQKENAELYFDATLAQKRPETTDKGKLILNQKTKLKTKYWQKYQLEFLSPPSDGPYRLFIYISDEHNKVATCNAAFYVIN